MVSPVQQRGAAAFKHTWKDGGNCAYVMLSGARGSSLPLTSWSLQLQEELPALPHSRDSLLPCTC